jgi:hypothetical protein
MMLFVIIFVLNSIGVIFLFRVRTKAKGKAKDLLIRACIHSLFQCAYILTIYLENGTYTAALVLLGASFIVNSAWGLAAVEVSIMRDWNTVLLVKLTKKHDISSLQCLC